MPVYCLAYGTIINDQYRYCLQHSGGCVLFVDGHQKRLIENFNTALLDLVLGCGSW